MVNQPKVKICGITNLADARFAAGAMADYLGFIFYEKSPRFIDPAEAGAIINWIEGPEKVGVFVNQPLDDVNRIAKESGLDLVQLHGNETLEYCQLIEKPIIKVIHIVPDYDTEELKAKVLLYSEVAKFLLFDSKIDNQWGGTGKTFDWDILNEITGDVPFFMSGGLKPANIKNAIDLVHPYAVDISSGVEEDPRIKDFEKIEAVMNVINSSN